jgi:hypothetical protein
MPVSRFSAWMATRGVSRLIAMDEPVSCEMGV